MVKGYVKVRKFAIPMRFKSLHPRMQSIWSDEPKDEHGTQCPRTDLNKRFLPKPMATQGERRPPKESKSR